ncbi:hypothetical protein [Bdellovibrio sp. HCB2-146]|uniref:hypothetical protein n=1 Tax=Bdellovibrio sp. HCB2-146 TaxID=3394362 RepID=UPI0039BD3A0C
MKAMFVTALFMTASVNVFAQTSTVKLNATEQQPAGESVLKVDQVSGNKKFEADKDITDAKLKADSGSLSRYSLKFSLSYYGPPVGDISNRKQPNPDGSIGSNDTALGGAISARYRLNSKSAISLGTGINARTPFHGTEQADVKNPFLGIDYSSRLGDVQMRNSGSVEAATVPEYREVGQYAGLDLKNSLVYNIGTSGFALGLDTSLNYFLYERGYEPKDRTAGRYVLSFYPEVKYNVSDKLNLSTSLAVKFLNPRARTSEADLLNRTLTSRIGMGYAFTRDIYFAPNLNFYPNDFAWESTTVNFSTIFSVL